MPVLDWSRTDLQVAAADGAITTRFEVTVMAAFDMFILQRPAANRITVLISQRRQTVYIGLTQKQKNKLVQTVLLWFSRITAGIYLGRIQIGTAGIYRLDAGRLCL